MNLMIIFLIYRLVALENSEKHLSLFLRAQGDVLKC